MERQYLGKPTDRRLVPEIKEQIPEADLFEQLQESETQLDVLINRKWLDLQDLIGRAMRRNKTLRIFVSSSVANQPWQVHAIPTSAFDFGVDQMAQEPPSWTLRIEGRLVDDPIEDHRSFSSMFTSIIVELYRDNKDAESLGDSAAPRIINPEVVEWHELPLHSTEPRIDFDGLDVRRRGDQPVKAKIIMQLKEYPDKFKLSPPLAQILGVEEESKPAAVVSIWQYIRFNKLQDVDEMRLIKCDAALKRLFGRDTITFPQLAELLNPHLTPRSPIVLEYVIDPRSDIANRDVAFDVSLQVDDPLRQELIAILDTWLQDSSALKELESNIINNVQTLNTLVHQRDFYHQLADNPIDFLSRWTASQARDLKGIYSDRQFSEEAVRHSSFYTPEVLNSSLHLFMNSK